MTNNNNNKPIQQNKSVNEEYYFLRAKANNIDEIFTIYQNKEKWLKNNKINQWLNYTQRYSKENFLEYILSNEMFIIKIKHKIVAVAHVICKDNSIIIKHFASIESGYGKVLISEIAKYYNIKWVITNDVHYQSKEDIITKIDKVQLAIEDRIRIINCQVLILCIRHHNCRI